MNFQTDTIVFLVKQWSSEIGKESFDDLSEVGNSYVISQRKVDDYSYPNSYATYR